MPHPHSAFAYRCEHCLTYTMRLVCIWKKWAFGALSVGAALLGQFFYDNSGHDCLSRHQYAVYCAVDAEGTLVLFTARWCNSLYLCRNHKFSASVLRQSTNFEGFWSVESRYLTPPYFFLWATRKIKFF